MKQNPDGEGQELDETKEIPEIDPDALDENIVEETGVDIITMKKFVDQLLEGAEKSEIRFEELEDRVQRMELNTGVREQLVRKGKFNCQFFFKSFYNFSVQNDLAAMIDRLNKVENTGKVKKVLESSGLDQESINTILEALNDMQDRITQQTNEKLETTVKEESMADLKNEVEVLNRRITFSEGVIQ